MELISESLPLARNCDCLNFGSSGKWIAVQSMTWWVAVCKHSSVLCYRARHNKWQRTPVLHKERDEMKKVCTLLFIAARSLASVFCIRFVPCKPGCRRACWWACTSRPRCPTPSGRRTSGRPCTGAWRGWRPDIKPNGFTWYSDYTEIPNQMVLRLVLQLLWLHLQCLVGLVELEVALGPAQVGLLPLAAGAHALVEVVEGGGDAADLEVLQALLKSQSSIGTGKG